MISLPILKSPFKAVEAYRSGTDQYMLLPFRFERIGEQAILTNFAGDYIRLSIQDLSTLVDHRLDPSTQIYNTLLSRHFIAESDSDSWIDLMAAAYRTRFEPVANFTGLHIFVVTLRCDHSCPYCQVSRAQSEHGKYDMTVDTARSALELVFQSPNPCIKIEFQGGESLLNFELIKLIVLEAKLLNVDANRELSFVIATNLAQLTNEMLEFCKQESICISTSLDGPADLHNMNRPRPGHNSHELAVDGIERCRKHLGQDTVSALMTTTKASLEIPEQIIDEYVRLGFNSIFLRWLSPYGFAVKSSGIIGYDTVAWMGFYEQGLRYILKLNQQGIMIREELASIILRKILTPFGCGYVDLQSPTGLGLSAVVYNYDGLVYASDESRMLAETGDTTFCLGTVKDSYTTIFGSEKLQSWVDQTMTEATPMCCDCAFEPWCGTDPVFHHAVQGDLVGHRPTSGYCARNMTLFKLLLELLDQPEYSSILRRWAL